MASTIEIGSTMAEKWMQVREHLTLGGSCRHRRTSLLYQGAMTAV